MSNDMKVSKYLVFPVVEMLGVGYMPAEGNYEKETARVFHVTATRATQRLVVMACGGSGFGKSLQS